MGVRFDGLRSDSRYIKRSKLTGHGRGEDGYGLRAWPNKIEKIRHESQKRHQVWVKSLIFK